MTWICLRSKVILHGLWFRDENHHLSLTIWEILGGYFWVTFSFSFVRMSQIPEGKWKKKHTEQLHPGSVVQIQQIWVNNNIWGSVHGWDLQCRTPGREDSYSKASWLQVSCWTLELYFIGVQSSTHSSRNWFYPYHPCMVYLPTFGWSLW